MTGSGFQVDAEKLRQDAMAIDEVIAGVDLVVDAGKDVTPGGWDLAFGVLFQFMAQFDHGVANIMINATTRVDEALHATQTNLNQAADSYADTDEASKNKLANIHAPKEWTRHIGEPVPGEPVTPR